VHGIHTTGIIADPPPTVCEQLGWSGEVRAVDLLLKPADQWFPTLAAAMTRLAMSVPKWQLGLDRQRYLAELPDLNERMADFKNQARWHGLDINLGLGWNWLDPLPQATEPPWSFLVYSASPPLAADELPGYLNRVLPVSRTSGKPA